jgi:serine/threonine-protein kinase
MTDDKRHRDHEATATAARRVLQLAAERGIISGADAESTVAEVRQRLMDAGLYDLEPPSLEIVLDDELLEDHTLARLARDLGLEDEDWLPPAPLQNGGHGTDPFETFPVSDWDRYEFVEFIGRGGMGDVFKARDRRLGRFVALKFLRRDDPEQVKRFLREAKVQAKVDHENLCEVYEVGEVDGMSYIAMQYISGGTIKEIADLLDVRDKVAIMVDVADGLHAAHQAGLIHRDIKPANVLVEREADGTWHPFVVDFGIAREVDTPHELTVSGMVLGTPAFCAPEQVRGETSTLDRRTDVYGLGATLYWLLTGQSPYSGAYPEIITGVTERDPTPPHRLDRTIPVDLETIVLKCLEKEQDRRYPSAREASEDLRRFLAGEPIVARRAGYLYKLGKRIRRHPGIAAAVVVVCLAFLALGLVSLSSNIRTRRQAAVAQRMIEQAKEIESFARVSAMMPLHDRSRERSRIRARMEGIEAEMERLGGIGAGPGLYALGRGHLTLQEFEAARDRLEQATERGYRSPGVSYALGLVLGRLYQRELELARRIEDDEIRSTRIAKIEVELREPALELLRSGSDSSMEAAGYAEALILFYAGRMDEALEATQAAFDSEAWLYEAKRLEGDILLDQGVEHRLAGDPDRALQLLELAGRSYATASRIARSDPSVHEGDCSRWIEVLEINSRRGEPVVDAFDAAVEACGRAVAIDAERFVVHERLSHLYWRWADIVNDRGGDPGPFLARSIDAAERAIELRPDSVAAHITRGGALTVAGLRKMSRGEDPRRDFVAAIASFEAAIFIDPGSVLAHDDLGYAWERLARYEMDQGLDPRPSLDRAVEAFSRAIELNPRYANAYNNSGIASWRRARYLMRTGDDPEADLQRAVEAFAAAIDRNPVYAYAFANRGLAGRTLGLHRLDTGQDPTAALDGARTDLDRALELNPQIYWAYPERTAVELLAARWSMRNGNSPTSRLDAAADSADKALAANPRNAVAYQSAAKVHLWRAEWRLLQGAAIQGEVVAGRRYVERALELNPRLASALVTGARLQVVQASAENDPRVRQALLADATASLDRALTINPLLEAETTDLRRRIEAIEERRGVEM